MGKAMARAACIGVAMLAVGAATRPEASAQGPQQIRQIAAHRGNYTSRSSRSIRRIVIHTVEGSESSCINWFQNPSARVSAHYVVSHAGRVTQMVPDMSVAWHATVYNADSIGIENEGYAARNGWTAAQYEALAHLVRGLCDRYGIPRTRERIVGPSQVPSSGKVDPGRYFDWNRFLTLVNQGASSAPPPPPPAPAPAPAPTPAPSGGRFGVEVTASALNVRAAPGGRVLGQASQGARYVVTAQSSGWMRIDWRGGDAWVSSAWVRRVAGEAEVVSASTLNVRDSPSTSAAVLGQTGQGQVHYRLGVSGDWVLIQFDGRRGWVHGDYTSSISLP